MREAENPSRLVVWSSFKPKRMDGRRPLGVSLHEDHPTRRGTCTVVHVKICPMLSSFKDRWKRFSDKASKLQMQFELPDELRDGPWKRKEDMQRSA